MSELCRQGPHPLKPATPWGRYLLESGHILANFEASMFEYISSRMGWTGASFLTCLTWDRSQRALGGRS